MPFLDTTATASPGTLSQRLGMKQNLGAGDGSPSGHLPPRGPESRGETQDGRQVSRSYVEGLAPSGVSRTCLLIWQISSE